MFKVRCKLISFAGNEEVFPCHFGYKLGDEFYYDGVYFSGKICPGLLASMTPVIHGVFLLGNKYFENVMYRYRGFDKRDPGMAKYDGVGFCPLEKPPEAAMERLAPMSTDAAGSTKARGGHFVCGDTRILAEFACEAVDLSDSEYAQPFYRREISILERIEAEPGISVDKIRDRFTDFEREKISPPLTTPLLEVLLDALTDMHYIEIRDGKAYATGREPPSRPKIG